MNPLSASSFIRHNKRKTISSVIIIIVAVCFVYIMQCFVQSIAQSIRSLDATRFKYSMGIVTTQAVPVIPRETIEQLENDEHIESLIPVSVQEITFSVPGSTTHTAAFGLDVNERERFMDKFVITLQRGRIPESGKMEIAIDSNVAKNNGLQVGDHVGSDFDRSQTLEGDYEVVGILENDSHLSIIGSPEPEDTAFKYGQRGYLIFAADGCYEQAEKTVTSLLRQGIGVWTLGRYNMFYSKNNQTFQILDMMALLASLVMVVCLACSKYAQYFERRTELGILSAIGFTRRELLKRTFKEVILINLAGLIAGFIIAVLLCKVIMEATFTAVGGTGVYIYSKAALLSLVAPSFSALFTFIPVRRMIGRIDALSIIEQN